MFVLFANGYSMHIMEGFLPKQWVVVWFIVCVPFWASNKDAAVKDAVCSSMVYRMCAVLGYRD